MGKDGLQRMLDFLNFLDEKGIHCYVEQIAPDSMQATLTVVGARIEVTFFVDHLEFSVFKGNEDVSRDETLLRELINKNST